MIRRCDGLCSKEVIVELPDQTRCALPAWMLDEAFCGSLTEAEHPVVSVSALCTLGELLDAQVSLVSSSHDECKVTAKEKDNDARRKRTSALAATELDGKRGTGSRGRPPSVSGTAGGAARERRRESGKQPDPCQKR